MCIQAFGKPLHVLLVRKRPHLVVIGNLQELSALVDAHDIEEPVCIQGVWCRITRVDLIPHPITYISERSVFQNIHHLTLSVMPVDIRA